MCPSGSFGPNSRSYQRTRILLANVELPSVITFSTLPTQKLDCVAELSLSVAIACYLRTMTNNPISYIPFVIGCDAWEGDGCEALAESGAVGRCSTWISSSSFSQFASSGTVTSRIVASED